MVLNLSSFRMLVHIKGHSFARLVLLESWGPETDKSICYG
jgi:hypothetical protein